MNAMPEQMPRPIPFKREWPAPDMSIFQQPRPVAPRMSEEEFSLTFGPWAEWIQTAAMVKGVPVDYVAAALLGTASAIIGNARWASPWQGWKEPPVLWVMLVGEPSAGKSPALDAVLDPVKEIERGLSEAYKTSRHDWETRSEIAALALERWKNDAKNALSREMEAPAKPDAADAGAAPLRERITISDVTTEKVASLLAASSRGLLLFRDELSGWLSSMDRYNGGGDRPFWLEAYGGRSYTVDRKSSPEPIVVDHLSVAILGGTQPDKLARLLVKTDDDGLLARFLIVFPDAVPLSRPQRDIDNATLQAAFERLRGLPAAVDEAGSQRPFLVPFSDAAATALQAFREECRSWEVEAAGLFKGHIGKMPGLAVRLACVLAHLDWAAQPGAPVPELINHCHVGRACFLVGDHFRRHAFRAYGAAEPPEEVRNLRKLATFLHKERLARVTARDIQRRDLAGLQTARQIEAAISALEQADWLHRYEEKTSGRPRIVYVVNPRIWEA